MAFPHPPPRIGLALGSGAARGWAHIGVINALAQAGIVPDVICGTSIGALVGATHAVGRLDWLEGWVRKLDRQGVWSMLDFRMGGGLIEGTRLMEFFRTHFQDPGIEHLALPFACVATELDTGREVWLREGPLIDAVRASIAMPGLFTPVLREGRLLVDGGLVDPVPVSLARALGAEIVIAVDLNWTLIGRHARTAARDGAAAATASAAASAEDRRKTGLLAALFERWRPSPAAPSTPAVETPSLLDVVSTAINVMQVRITQSRLAGEPADVVIRPLLSDIAAMDFHRGAPAIHQGEVSVQVALPHIREVLGR